MSGIEINDYLSKCDKDLANNVIYRVYGMPGPIFMEEDNDTPEPGPEPGPDYSIPFYVENITDEEETLTIAERDWTEQDNYLEIPVEYSTDGTTWNSFGTTGETPLTRTLQPSDKVYLRATTNTWNEYQEEPYIEHGCFIFGVSKVGGNIMSLLYGSSFTGNETTFPANSVGNFNRLFNDVNDEDGYNRHLISASELILPATILTDFCYGEMFRNCIALTTAPALPATILTDFCYDSMFGGCSSLTAAPVLPATTLADHCYYGMFGGCSSLTAAPVLPATTLADYCYDSMFGGCSSLTAAPALPATTLAYQCYNGMFESCSSLTTAPATLPATTLTENCYTGMFSNCSSLTTAPVLPATTLAEDCYANMFGGCSSLTAAPSLPVTTLADGCYSEMFRNCIALTTAPSLPATTLADYCYANMFNSCTNLNYIKCFATDISASDCTINWTSDVAATGTFVKNPNMSGWISGTDGIPEGWTVQDAQD